MIVEGATTTLADFEAVADVFVYGLGYEARSTHLARHMSSSYVFALQLPAVQAFSYKANLLEAASKRHLIFDSHKLDFPGELASKIGEFEVARIIVDISSMNRTMMFEVMVILSQLVRTGDQLRVVYVPSRYSVPEQTFPQIERVGPLSPIFSSFGADSSKPIGLILGTGFEPGITVGIITQLEPQVGYCLWGSGVDDRFDKAVRAANFDFEFNGYNVKPVMYNINDPVGLYRILDNLSYGLSSDYNVVFVLLGPKIFSLASCLVSLSRLGQSAVWRVQHSGATMRDALPGKGVVSATIDIDLFQQAGLRVAQVMGSDIAR